MTKAYEENGKMYREFDGVKSLCAVCNMNFTEWEWNHRHEANDDGGNVYHADCCPDCKEVWIMRASVIRGEMYDRDTGELIQCASCRHSFTPTAWADRHTVDDAIYHRGCSPITKMGKKGGSTEYPGIKLAQIEMAIQTELRFAISTYPDWPDDIVHAAAIVAEEAGELLQVANNVRWQHKDGGSVAKLRKEAIQTAAMAVRFLMNLEDDK